MSRAYVVNNIEASYSMLDEADQIVDAAMEFTGIDPSSAPVRFGLAQKAARYAAYAALGIIQNYGEADASMIGKMTPVEKERHFFLQSLNAFENQRSGGAAR